MPGRLDRNRMPEVAAQKVHLIGANAIEDLLGGEREVTTRVCAQLSAWDPPRGPPAQLGRVDIVVLEDAIEGRTVDPANLPGEFVGGRQGDTGADLVAPGRSRRAVATMPGMASVLLMTAREPAHLLPESDKGRRGARRGSYRGFPRPSAWRGGPSPRCGEGCSGYWWRSYWLYVSLAVVASAK